MSSSYPRIDSTHFDSAPSSTTSASSGCPTPSSRSPRRCPPEEYELIKRHPEDGAHIVGKFGPLRATVTMIRHHHERWDGRGYPDGLGAEEIPLEAAVVGLADAWDAMTTVRPYSRALNLQEALREVREGRGTQFAPEVVDAFFAAYRRHPTEFFTSETDESGLHLVADTA